MITHTESHMVLEFHALDPTYVHLETMEKILSVLTKSMNKEMKFVSDSEIFYFYS